jgi:hypothetical protein
LRRDLRRRPVAWFAQAPCGIGAEWVLAQ